MVEDGLGTPSFSMDKVTGRIETREEERTPRTKTTGWTGGGEGEAVVNKL